MSAAVSTFARRIAVSKVRTKAFANDAVVPQ